MVDRVASAPAWLTMLRSRSAREDARAADSDDTGDIVVRTGDWPRRDKSALRRQVAGIVRDVDVDNPVAVAKVRSRVTRAILLWEFGSELREHPDWPLLLERAADTFADDGPLHLEFARMIDELRR